jgi:hypothetical protein
MIMISNKIQEDFASFLNTYEYFLNSEQFKTLFNPCKCVSLIQVNNYFSDSEHGFFHGLMVSFMCYLINDESTLVERKSEIYQIFASATLHDFLKPNGVHQKEHDVKLRNYYDKLCEETYSHSNPPETDQNKHLIIADRLELRRYNDYKDWVDQRFYELYNIMSPELSENLQFFYISMRPSLELHYNTPDSRVKTKFNLVCDLAKSRMISLCKIYT